MPMAALVSVCVLLALEYIRRKRAAGVTFPLIDEALKALPIPIVGYGTMKPDAENSAAIDPPNVPAPEAAKAPEAKAPEAKAPETQQHKAKAPEPDHGLTAPLSEVGYGTVAALRSNKQTKIYVKRVLEDLGGRLEREDSAEFSRFVSEYSGINFVRSFRRMTDALRRAPWVTFEKVSVPTNGIEEAMSTVGDMAFFLPCVGGEGAVLMNEDGRPAVANIDLILKGLTQDAAIASDDEDEDETEQEQEDAKQAQPHAESFQANDAARRLGLVLPPLPSPKLTPQTRILESSLLPEEDPIMKSHAEDSTTAAAGDTTYFLSCVGGEGSVLMNEEGRPAVANIDLILKGLTKSVHVTNEVEDGETESNQSKEEKLAQVLLPAGSCKADNTARQSGLVPPCLPSSAATPIVCEADPDGSACEKSQAEDPIIAFVVPQGFDGQVGLIPGARPPQPCFVKAIVPGSWADSCGLRVEDEILAVNGISVSKFDRTSFHEEMQKRPLELSIRTKVPPLLD